MIDDPAKPKSDFDPIREAGYAGIKIMDRADGGREFVLPATRNFREKIPFTIFWLGLTAFVAGFAFFFTLAFNALPLPGVVRFFVYNHIYFILGILALFDLAFAIGVADMWLRSSRVVATAGKLQLATHWLFIKRATTVSADKIIEIRVDATGSDNNRIYYDVRVLTVGDKPGWLASLFPAKPHPNSSFSANDLKAFNSGGKRLRVATDIEGEAEAKWFAAELRRLLKLDNAAAPSSIGTRPGS